MVSTVTNTKFLMGVAVGVALVYLYTMVLPRVRGAGGKSA